MKPINFFAAFAVIVVCVLKAQTGIEATGCMGMAGLIAIDGLCETIKRRPVLVIAAPNPEPEPTESKEPNNEVK